MTKTQVLTVSCEREEELTRLAWDQAIEARNQWRLCRRLHSDQEVRWEKALRALNDYKETNK